MLTSRSILEGSCALLFATVLLALSGPCHSQGVDGPAGLKSRLSPIFAEWSRPDSPGCAVGLIRNGQLVFEQGFGSANLDYEIPITADTVFYVGSVSKQFTAAATLLLAEDGSISLEDGIRKYLPELPQQADSVKIRHLIHHTSGFPDIYQLMRQNGLALENVFSDSEALTLIAEKGSLQFQPGEKFEYSNSGYFLLSQLFQRVGRGSLREYAEERIFKPLGMVNTHFHDTPDHVLKNRAVSYAPQPVSGFRITYLGNFNKVGAGGLYTTVRDLALWDQNFYKPRIGSPSFTTRLEQRAELNDGTLLDYASGLQHGQFLGHRTIGHDGSMMGFKASLLRFPDDRLTVVCLCNLETIEPARLVERIANSLLGP